MEEQIKLNTKNFMNITKKLSKYLYGHNGFIAGGCFKNILTDTPCKDIDIFFRNIQDFDMAVCVFEKDNNYTKIYNNDNAIGYIENDTNMKIDLVQSRFGTPEEIINAFDFTITKMAFSIEGKDYQIICHQDFFEHLFTKRLVIDNEIPFPLSTFNRALRYTKYGYNLCFESKEKLIKAIRESQDTNLGNDFYKGFD